MWQAYEDGFCVFWFSCVAFMVATVVCSFFFLHVSTCDFSSHNLCNVCQSSLYYFVFLLVLPIWYSMVLKGFIISTEMVLLVLLDWTFSSTLYNFFCRKPSHYWKKKHKKRIPHKMVTKWYKWNLNSCKIFHTIVITNLHFTWICLKSQQT